MGRRYQGCPGDRERGPEAEGVALVASSRDAGPPAAVADHGSPPIGSVGPTGQHHLPPMDVRRCEDSGRSTGRAKVSLSAAPGRCALMPGDHPPVKAWTAFRQQGLDAPPRQFRPVAADPRGPLSKMRGSPGAGPMAARASPADHGPSSVEPLEPRRHPDSDPPALSEDAWIAETAQIDSSDIKGHRSPGGAKGGLEPKPRASRLVAGRRHSARSPLCAGGRSVSPSLRATAPTSGA